jgi:hypothetical protein
VPDPFLPPGKRLVPVEPGTGPFASRPVSRRSLLKALGSGTLVGLVLPRDPRLLQRLGSVVPNFDADQVLAALRQAQLASGPVSKLPAVQRVWRSNDLLLVYLQYINLELDAAKSPAVLVATDPSTPSYLVVTFQGQHVLEQALASSAVSSGQTDQTQLPDALLSGNSRLVFQLEGTDFAVPFAFDTLFSWVSDDFVPSLSPYADQPPGVGPYPAPPSSAPAATETAIEAPWQLIMTPDSSGGWNHSLTPVTHGAWTEIWHTRLGVVKTKKGQQSVVEPPAVRPNLRAVWTPGYGIALAPPADPFTPTALSNQNRFDLVHNMTTYLTGGPPYGYIATPAKVNQFHMSALGASMEIIGDWPGATTTTGLVSWLQRSSGGRDSYVRVEQAGYLFPTGHRASLITVTDRQFVSNAATHEVEAFLVNYSYLVVRDPLVNYAADPFDQQNIGRGLPWRQLTLSTVVTPPINTTSGPPLLGLSYPPAEIGDAFWITDATTGAEILFDISGVDWAGANIDFQMPLAFVSAGSESSVDPYDPSSGGAASEIIQGYATDPRAVINLSGQKLTFAAASAGSTNTTHSTQLFTFGAILPDPSVSEVDLIGADQPAWYPQWSAAQVDLTGLSQLAGVSALPSISPNSDYLANNYSASNVAEIFADIASAPSVVFGSANATGVATPNFAPTALSRQLGPLADAASFLTGVFDPLTYFSDDAMLLGGISLGQIIQKVVGDALLDSAPNLTVQAIDDPVTNLPTAFVVSYTLAPDLQSDKDGGGIGLFNPHPDASLVIQASITVPVANPSQATSTMNAVLSEFDVDLFGADPSDQFFVIGVEKLTFTAATGQKSAVTVSISSVTFGQALSFVDILQEFMSSDDDDSGPSIDVEPSGITVSYGLPIPDATLGAVSIFNMSLNAELDIPLDGSPITVTFAFCSQETPFQLAIGIFGGGGFFAISLTVAGVQELQASLEVGLVAALDLGVASGSASLEAGIYFSLTIGDNGSQSINLTGFLRAEGILTFLGIVAISVDLYLGLTYLQPGMAYGEASITVNVSVLFFSKSVTATCRRTIGGGSDPTFAELMTKTDWANYARAFAA